MAQGSLRRPRPLHERCSGEYASRDRDESEILEAARQTFRESVWKEWPAILVDLRKVMLPMFWHDVSGTAYTPDQALVLDDSADRALNDTIGIDGLADPRFARLREPFQRWAQDYNMEGEDWFLDDLLRTLYFWAKSPKLRDKLLLDPRGSGSVAAVSEHEAGLQFLDRGWFPTLEKWVEFSDRVSKDFENTLSAYEHRIRALVESRDFIRVPRKRSAAPFDWLVLWQIANYAIAKIADWQVQQNGKVLSETRIGQGIQEAARLLGFKNLRKAKRGPQRKPKLEK